MDPLGDVMTRPPTTGASPRRAGSGCARRQASSTRWPRYDVSLEIAAGEFVSLLGPKRLGQTRP